MSAYDIPFLNKTSPKLSKLVMSSFSSFGMHFSSFHQLLTSSHGLDVGHDYVFVM
jgi:hypothetical protein